MKRIQHSLAVLLIAAAVSTAQRGPATVVVAPTIKEKVNEGRAFVGTVWPIRVSQVGSAASGRVEKFFVREGARVKKGDHLAKLRTKIIEARVAAAKAALELREAELAEMLAGNRKEEVDQAVAKLESAKTAQEFRQQKLKRARALVGRGVSREELEEAISQSNQADALVREMQANLTLLRAGFRKEKQDQAKARVLEQKAIVAQLEEERDRHTIVAPFDGFVLAERAEEGQWVTPGTLIAQIAEMDDVYVQAEVLEDYISKITKGTPATVTLDALPGEAFSGNVEVILPQGDTSARTFPVKVRVKNQPAGKSVKLKSGMFARVTFSVGHPTEAILVPKDALVLGGRLPQVYVLKGEPGSKATVKPVEVRLGISTGSHVQVLGDINEGDLVVVQGNERLRPGQEVIATTAK